MPEHPVHLGPLSQEPDTWVEVYRCSCDSAGHEHALVLAALDIDYSLVCQDDAYVLLVPAEEARRAREELTCYQLENQDWPPAEISPPRVSSGFHGVMGYCTLLLATFALERSRGVSLDWWEAGIGHSGLIRQGEWWRAVTALTLHADADHLAGNLLFGSLFIALLCREIGTGPAWFSVLLAGAVGNLASALLRPSLHTFVGASTAVFAAIGILAMWQWRRPHASTTSRLRQWSPLMAGAAFLGYLGTTGERTDVLAHLAGLVSGMATGLGWNLWAGQTPLPRWGQRALAWATLLLLVLSWFFAVK